MGTSLYTYARADIVYRRRSGKHPVSDRHNQEGVFTCTDVILDMVMDTQKAEDALSH